jgi:hypothetical protein
MDHASKMMDMVNITSHSLVETALDERNVSAVRSLLAQHLDELKQKGWFSSLFYCAARRDYVEMLPIFVEFGADINAPDDRFGEPSPEGVIYTAACAGAVNAVRWLVEHGAKVNHQVDGVTRCVALTGACCDGHLEVVKLLVERGGADVNAVWMRRNALSDAMMYGHKEVAAYLRSRGALEPWQLAAGQPPHRDAVLAHVERHLGKPQPLSLQEIVPGDPPVSIHVVPMLGRLALVTDGMSSRAMTVPPGAEAYRFAELVMYLPPGWPLGAEALGDPNHAWPIHWLRRIARYPHEHHTWLGAPSAIIANGEPPEPLAPNTRLSCLFVTTQQSDFGWLTLPDGRRVAFYSVHPLYTEERDLEKQKGVEYLVGLFQKHNISTVVDVHRPNLALASDRPRGSRRG